METLVFTKPKSCPPPHSRRAALNMVSVHPCNQWHFRCAKGLTGVGVGDLVGLIGVEPDFVFAALEHARRKSLLESKGAAMKRAQVEYMIHRSNRSTSRLSSYNPPVHHNPSSKFPHFLAFFLRKMAKQMFNHHAK